MSSLYAILDAEAVDAAGKNLLSVARELREAGVELLQYRDKLATRDAMFANARQIHAIFERTATTLILNDSPEVCVAAAWDGVHVGQGDSSVEQARRVVGPDRIIGVSTHNEAEVRSAQLSEADYIAIGPVFLTASKRDTEAEVGLAGVAMARALTDKPLVAIGGIGHEQAAAVLHAGADAVAVISALLRRGATVKANARQLLQQW